MNVSVAFALAILDRWTVLVRLFAAFVVCQTSAGSYTSTPEVSESSIVTVDMTQSKFTGRKQGTEQKSGTSAKQELYKKDLQSTPNDLRWTQR